MRIAKDYALNLPSFYVQNARTWPISPTPARSERALNSLLLNGEQDPV